MKNVFLILALFVCGATFASTPSKHFSRQEIQIKDAIIPGTVDQMRSLLPCAEAWADYTTESIEIYVNVPVGCVDVVITNMNGTAVAGATIDTDATPFITLPMPAPGMYRLTISGPEYRGDGEFLIEE